jgi:hypothetical protein
MNNVNSLMEGGVGQMLTLVDLEEVGSSSRIQYSSFPAFIYCYCEAETKIKRNLRNMESKKL